MFWQKESGRNVACNMLVKLTTGQKVLRHILQVQALLQQGQATGRAVHCQARAEHGLRRWLRQALRLLPQCQRFARRVSIPNHVW